MYYAWGDVYPKGQAGSHRNASYNRGNWLYIYKPWCHIIPASKNEYLVLALGEGDCSSGSSRLYRLGVSRVQKAKVSGDQRPRLRAS